MEMIQGTRHFSPRSALANLFFLGTSVALIFICYRMLHGKFTSVISRDATINGVVIDLKTPSSGEVLQLTKETGKEVNRNEVIAVLENKRASQLKIQELTSKLNEQKKRLESARAHLIQQVDLLKTLEVDLQNQRNLQVRLARDRIAGANAQIEQARAEYELARKKYQRASFLAREGAISHESVDLALSQLQQSEAELKDGQAHLQQLRSEENAARLDLHLQRSNSNYDPKIRLQGLQMDIANQQQAIRSIQQSISGTQNELAEARKDFDRQKKVTIAAPVNGIMWLLNTRLGEFLKEGESLGSVLDCNRRWVDVYVEERALRSLHPGMLATIKPYGTDRSFQGRITLVRSGVGRLSAGEDVVIPLKTNLPRQSQVRVEFEPGTETGAPEHLCYVGYTARVLFQVQ